MNVMSQSNPPSRSPRVVHSSLSGGEVVLLNLETGQYHELNAIGALIWDLLDGSRGTEEVSAKLREKVKDPPSDLDAIVAGFLSDLEERGLVS